MSSAGGTTPNQNWSMVFIGRNSRRDCGNDSVTERQILRDATRILRLEIEIGKRFLAKLAEAKLASGRTYLHSSARPALTAMHDCRARPMNELSIHNY